MFTKLFASITDSSIWSEDSDTKVVWITMLAMADASGYIAAALPGISKRSGVCLQKTEEALTKFESPDPYSRSSEFEGRRIQRVQGGWILLNYEKYREMRSEEERREYMRNYMKEYRTKNGDNLSEHVNNSVNFVSKCKPLLAKAEAEAEAEEEHPSSHCGTPSEMPPGALKALRGTPSKRSRSLSPEIWEFRKQWCSMYEAVFGEKYLWNDLKDDSCAEKLLSHADRSKHMEILAVAWKDLTDFDFKQALSVCGYFGRFNQIKLKVLGKHNKPKPNKLRPSNEEIEQKLYGDKRN